MYTKSAHIRDLQATVERLHARLEQADALNLRYSELARALIRENSALRSLSIDTPPPTVTSPTDTCVDCGATEGLMSLGLLLRCEACRNRRVAPAPLCQNCRSRPCGCVPPTGSLEELWADTPPNTLVEEFGPLPIGTRACDKCGIVSHDIYNMGDETWCAKCAYTHDIEKKAHMAVDRYPQE